MSAGGDGLLALLSFVEYLPADSALHRELYPKDEGAKWTTTLQTNIILADLFDLFAIAHTRKGRKAPEYPRPKERKTIGHGAVPIEEFWEFWNKER